MKRFRSHILLVGLWLIAVIILEAISINPKDATSELPPKPPPYAYLISIISDQQPKLDPILSQAIAKFIYRNSLEYNLNPELIVSLISVESSFIPTAVSSADCLGLMQINPKAHPEKIEGLDHYQLFHIDNNIRIGCEILKEYYDATGSISGALERYLGKANTTYTNKVLTKFADLTIEKNNL